MLATGSSSSFVDTSRCRLEDEPLAAAQRQKEAQRHMQELTERERGVTRTNSRTPQPCGCTRRGGYSSCRLAGCCQARTRPRARMIILFQFSPAFRILLVSCNGISLVQRDEVLLERCKILLPLRASLQK